MLIHFVSLQRCLIWMLYINGTIQHATFCDELLSVGVFSSFVHSFSRLNDFPTGYRYYILCIYSSADGHKGCFSFLVIRKNAATNIHVQVSVWACVFTSLWYIPRSEITASHGYSVFNLLRNCQTVFQNSCTILQSHRPHVRIPISPHLPQPLRYLSF